MLTWETGCRVGGMFFVLIFVTFYKFEIISKEKVKNVPQTKTQQLKPDSRNIWWQRLGRWGKKSKEVILTGQRAPELGVGSDTSKVTPKDQVRKQVTSLCGLLSLPSLWVLSAEAGHREVTSQEGLYRCQSCLQWTHPSLTGGPQGLMESRGLLVMSSALTMCVAWASRASGS